MAENVIFSGNPLSGFILDANYGYLTVKENPDFSLVSGETYTVVWDDGAYENVTAYDATIPGVGTFVAIGNGTALGYQGNNEPFVIAVNSEQAYFLAFTDGASSHLVSISKIDTTENHVTEIRIASEDFVWNEQFGAYTATVEKAWSLIEGASYQMIVNGASYDLAVAYDITSLIGMSMIAVGNLSILELPGNDAPCIVGDGGTYNMFLLTEIPSGDYTFSVSQVIEDDPTYDFIDIKNSLFIGNPLNNFIYDTNYQCYGTTVENPGFVLVSGRTYKVVWDDVEKPFIATAYNATLPGIGDLVAIGNGSAFGYPGNNEPFVLSTNSERAYFLVLNGDTASSHTVAISYAIADVVLLDRRGVRTVYPGVTTLEVDTADGGTREFVDSETLPEAVEDMPIGLNFRNVDSQKIIAPAGIVAKSAIIQKPVNLRPEYIAEGVNIAGIIGTLIGGGGDIVSYTVMTADVDTTDGHIHTLYHDLGRTPDIAFIYHPPQYEQVPSDKYWFAIGLSTAAINAGISFPPNMGIYQSSDGHIYSDDYSYGIDITDTSYPIHSANAESISIRTGRLSPSHWYKIFLIAGLT